jgi:hypothetical protein
MSVDFNIYTKVAPQSSETIANAIKYNTETTCEDRLVEVLLAVLFERLAQQDAEIAALHAFVGLTRTR